MEDMDLQVLKNSIADIIAAVAGPQALHEASEIVRACGKLGEGDAYVGTALALARVRADGAPLGRVTGSQNFLGARLMTGPEVLVAREETELLGREVIALLRDQAKEEPERELRLIDMGCGSGNISCSAALALPRLKVWACDLTNPCVQLTQANAALNGLKGRVEVFQGDLFEPLSGCGLESAMDLVAMNPPYIASTSLEKQRATLLRHEPREAFDGGPFGISIQARLIREAPAFIRPGGALVIEFGKGQVRQVSALVERCKLYAEMRFVSDAELEPRVVVLTK